MSGARRSSGLPFRWDHPRAAGQLRDAIRHPREAGPPGLRAVAAGDRRPLRSARPCATGGPARALRLDPHREGPPRGAGRRTYVLGYVPEALDAGDYTLRIGIGESGSRLEAYSLLPFAPDPERNKTAGGRAAPPGTLEDASARADPHRHQVLAGKG